MSARTDLDLAWAEWQTAELYKKWRRSNPGEAQKLDDYRAGGPRPALATATGRALVYESSAWLALEEPPPPEPQGEIPNWAMTLQPGWKQAEDSTASRYQAIWVYPQSPTTPWQAPNGRDPNRHLLLDPRYRDAGGRAGQDEWWFIIERLWPASFDPAVQGGWGREFNCHNVAGDAGNAENGSQGGIGWQPGFGSPSSSLALDWDPGKPGPSIDLLSTWGSEGGFDLQLPTPPRDEWQTYLLRWIAGRTDGSTVRPGLAQVWVNGDPVLDRRNLNTVQRAKGPIDGKEYNQRWMSPWDGNYSRGITGPVPMTFTATRMGATFAAAVADRPRRLSDSSGRQVRYEGSAPAPTLVTLPLRSPSAARLPVLA